MTTYWITKREPCPKCDGRGYNIIDAEKGIAAICEDGFSQCSNGYIETQIDADQWLIERLGQIEWTSPTGFADFLPKTERMIDVRYKDE